MCQVVGMASSGRLVAALSEALHTRGTTFQQPEGTLNNLSAKGSPTVLRVSAARPWLLLPAAGLVARHSVALG